MTKVIALRDHVYDGIQRRTGDRYEAQADLVPRMIAVGFVAVDETEAEKPKKRSYKRRDMKADDDS